MLTGNFTYPVWGIKPNFVADNPRGPKLAIEFIEANPFFSILYKTDAKHLAVLFAATDLTRSGLSEDEVLKVVKFQKEHLSLYRESLSQYNFLDSLTEALQDGDTSLLMDCFVLIIRNYDKSTFFIAGLSDEYKGSEASIFIKATLDIAYAKPKVKKGDDYLQIAIEHLDFKQLPSINIISTVIPLMLDLSSPHITENDKIFILNNLRCILNHKT